MSVAFLCRMGFQPSGALMLALMVPYIPRNQLKNRHFSRNCLLRLRSRFVGLFRGDGPLPIRQFGALIRSVLLLRCVEQF